MSVYLCDCVIGDIHMSVQDSGRISDLDTDVVLFALCLLIPQCYEISILIAHKVLDNCL